MSIFIREDKGNSILIQAGNGVPSHLSTIGSLFVDKNTAIPYINKNGLSNWSQIFDNTSIIGNISSTGVVEFGGILKTSNTTFSVSAATGWIVDTVTNPYQPIQTYVTFSGQTGIDSPYRTSATITYILLTSGGTLAYQPTPPTPQQRRQNIYLGKIGHPDKATYSIAFQVTDHVQSPMSQLRDMFIPIPLINGGIGLYANTGLTFANTAGVLYGLGISFPSSPLSPNSIDVPAQVPVLFQYRTQTGGTVTATTIVDPLYYDVGGVRTAVGSPAKQATNQRIFLLQDGSFRIQYGQAKYTDLTTAVAAIPTESFVTFPNFKDNGILIGILSMESDVAALTDTAKAKFTSVSKFGESAGSGGGGGSTATLQTAYNNSTTPEIITNSILDGFTIRRGSASDSDNLIEFQNGTGGTVSTVNALGNATFKNVFINANVNTSYNLDVSGSTRFSSSLITGSLTATTISATTYQNLPIKYYAEFSGAPSVSPIVLAAGSISIGDGAESRSTYMLSLGQNSGKNATGTTYTVFIGVNSGYDASGSTYSNFIGSGAGVGAINTNNSSFIGTSAGLNSTGATQSNFFGYDSGRLSKSLDNSNVFGYQAGYNVTNANYVNFFGHQVGWNATNATQSNFIGFGAGANATNAQYSNFIGRWAGNGASNASYSVLIGYEAGRLFPSNNIGTNNIIIGSSISLPSGTTNSLNIGGVLFGTGLNTPSVSDPIIVPSNGKIGVNVVSPVTTLDVNGTTRITGGLTASSITSTGVTTLGSGTFTKAGSGSGDVTLDNGSTDTPAILMYYANNTNWGIDSNNQTFDVLSGQIFRVVNKLNETGGAVKLAIDTTGNAVFTGFIKPGAWRAGQTILDTMLSNTEITVSTTTIATSTSDTDFITYSYTPSSSSSYLIIHYHLADYSFASGTGNDSYISRIKVDGSEITYSKQSTVNGNRSGVLFPLTGRYTNSSTTAKSIVVACRRDSADDSITITNSSTSMWLRITEIAR